MKKLFKVLKFFRITDEDDLLSLTHLCVYIGMYKVITTQAADLQDVGLFITALMNYGYKKYVNKDK